MVYNKVFGNSQFSLNFPLVNFSGTTGKKVQIFFDYFDHIPMISIFSVFLKRNCVHRNLVDIFEYI